MDSEILLDFGEERELIQEFQVYMGSRRFSVGVDVIIRADVY